jgi:hypothetical protein
MRWRSTNALSLPSVGRPIVHNNNNIPPPRFVAHPQSRRRALRLASKLVGIGSYVLCVYMCVCELTPVVGGRSSSSRAKGPMVVWRRGRQKESRACRSGPHLVVFSLKGVRLFGNRHTSAVKVGQECRRGDSCFGWVERVPSRTSCPAFDAPPPSSAQHNAVTPL